MNKTVFYSLLILGWILCGFGQPAYSKTLSILAGMGGYACIFYAIQSIPRRKSRFILGFLWFAAVQAVQFFWFLSHPFLYIYAVYVFIITVYALQFGLLCALITKERLKNRVFVIAIPAFWVLMEWSRLFIFSGVSFNSVGLSLTGSLYSMQMASLFGVFGLSFWVILTALLLAKRQYFSWAMVAATPYLFGIAHLGYHTNAAQKDGQSFHALLVQPAFPVEEALSFPSAQAFLRYVVDEWNQILKITAPHAKEKRYDLIVMPEMVVPFSTYMLAYPHAKAVELFEEHYGEDALAYLPNPTPPYGDDGYVNNAFFVQGMANIFKTLVLTGMEDVDYTEEGNPKLYSSALLFHPQEEGKEYKVERYEKRILVPMGEYIPFPALAELARSYGVTGSFTPGTEAKIMQCGKFTIAPTVCYDETFGSLTKDGCAKGAQILVNVTNDAWFPGITNQHMEHARVRTVEGGVPLLRACNTGVTCAIGSFGETIAELGQGESHQSQISAALPVHVPVYTYHTLYKDWGDTPLIGFCFVCLVGLIPRRRAMDKVD